MRSLFVTLLFAICFVFPTNVYSEALPPPQDSRQSVTPPNSNNSQSVTRPSNHGNDERQKKRPAVSRPIIKPDNNHRPSRPSNNHRPSTSTRPTHYYNSHYTNPTRTHGRIYYVSRRTYTPRYSTVIVYDRPSTVEYMIPDENTTVKVATSSDVDYNKTFGIGFIGAVELNSPIGNLDSHSSGGFGFYIKYRPVRYFSIEFTNDYLFGTLKYTDNYLYEYTKILLALGTRIHFLDYGIVDTYAVLAASMSIISYPDDPNYRQHTHISSQEYQYGGQFGIGFSYITGIFEIGLDVRYTIESVPDYIPYYISNDDKVIHGGLLTLSIGLAL